MPDLTLSTTPPLVRRPADAPWSRTTEELQALIRRADGGDMSAVPEVRQLLASPGAAALLGGDLARRAEEALLDALCKTRLAARECMLRVMADLRAELAGPNPPPVERLLAERVVACWLHLNSLELSYASKETMPLELAQHYQKCIDRAHKRYLSALKTLADVRKLGVTVQLNVARKQVNIAGAAAQIA